MNRVNELIKEYCPDGVPFQKVKDVYTRVKGTPITAGKMKEIACDDGEIRIFAGGKTIIDAHEKDIPKANITRVPAVLVQSRGVIDVVYYDKPFTFKNEMWAYTSEDIVSVKFLYYVLKNSIQNFRDAASGMGALPQISLKVTEEFMLPVPPLEVQREIVHILDYFTLLTAELTAELTARKKQYEFYRDTLLSHNGIYPMKPLAELGKWSGGKTPSMSEKSFWEQGTIPWISSKDMKSATLEDTQDHITEKAVKEASMTVYPANSIAVVTRSGILKHTFPVAYVPFETTINQDIKMLVVSEDILPRYAFHVIQGKGNDILIKTKKQGGTVDSLDFQKVLAYKVPVPSKDIQSKLVEVLDNFEAICTDLNIGLPAEIEARQKQYEYYRDLLLTFAETGSTLMTDRQTDRQTELSAIKLIQYVFGYAMVSLDYIADFRNGKGHEKSIVADGRYIVVNSKFISTDGQVRKYSDDQICPLYVNDILMVMSDLPNGRALAKCYLVDEDDKYTLNQRIGAFTVSRPDLVTTKYLYYILSRNPQLLRYDNGADQTNLRKADILNISIAIPTVKEQKKITEILDHFNSFCNDLSTGLPAEIEARQKQYEYYRDKLLSFKELPK